MGKNKKTQKETKIHMRMQHTTEVVFQISLNLEVCLTNRGGGTAKFKLFSETSNPFWAHATRRKAMKNS